MSNLPILFRLSVAFDAQTVVQYRSESVTPVIVPENGENRVREELNGGVLAYLGDAVIELWVRELLISKGITSSAVASAEARLFVTAKAQSEAYETVKDTLTDEEADVFRRGRNAHVTVPKSASAAEYHRATGFEALMAALWLEGRRERVDELMHAAYGDKVRELDERHK